MRKYETLLKELDRCDYIVDFQYTGKLADYSYNGITYEQSTETYAQILEDMYHDFLAEWGTLSDEERKSVKGYMELIISKRYLYDEFFFDVPSREIINGMANDNGVPRQSVEMARFVCNMAGQQKFYLERLRNFFDIKVVEKEVCNVSPEIIEEDSDFGNAPHTSMCEKEWITYDELIQMFNFRGVKSAKDPKWRKRNGFEKCVSQAGGKGCAVKYSVSKIKEWLDNGSTTKKRQ